MSSDDFICPQNFRVRKAFERNKETVTNLEHPVCNKSQRGEKMRKKKNMNMKMKINRSRESVQKENRNELIKKLLFILFDFFVLFL